MNKRHENKMCVLDINYNPVIGLFLCARSKEKNHHGHHRLHKKGTYNAPQHKIK